MRKCAVLVSQTSGLLQEETVYIESRLRKTATMQAGFKLFFI